MYEHLNISYGNAQEKMQICKELGLITPYKNGYKIQIGCFEQGNTVCFPPNTPPLYKEVYKEINLHCQKLEIDTPLYEKKLIAQIAANYPHSEKDLEQLEDREKAETYSLRFQLAKRLPQVYEPIQSLNYFVKVLTNEDFQILRRKNGSSS